MNPHIRIGSQGAESRRGRSTTSKLAVCTACRQSKVRCTGSQDGSCERCIKLELDCHRDPGFKRISKSRKIAELEKQVQSLASALRPAGQSLLQTTQFQQEAPLGEARSRGNKENTTNGLKSTFESPGWQQHPLGLPLPESSMVRPSAVMPRMLEAVQFNPVQIDALFQAFFEHYHHILPFLDPSKSPDDYYKSGIGLFWAIIGVASRRYREDITLLYVLSDWVMKLIWAEISKPPYKVSTVQAIIVLCIWPFPTTTTYNDVSVVLSAIAISASMQVGLYMPFHTQDFSRTKSRASGVNETDSEILTRTWAAANIVSQFSSTVVGQLPNAPFDWTIDRACEIGNIYTLPDDIRFKLIIQRYCNRVTKIMWNIVYDVSTAQLSNRPLSFVESWERDMTTLEIELNKFESEHAQLFSTMDRLYLAAARLNLNSFYFFDTSVSESRKQGILKAYTSAVNLVSLYTSADASNEALLYLPHYHSRMLLTATCLVIKVLKSSYASELGDTAYGRRTINACILALSRCSVSDNDVCGKAVKLMSKIWHREPSNDRTPPQLTIKSRGSASIMYDFIWTWRKDLAGLPRTNTGPSNETLLEESLAAQFASSLEDGSMFNLDFLDDPGWNLGLAEHLMFPVTDT